MIKKEVATGVLVGLIANSIGLFLAAKLLGGGESFTTTLKNAHTEGVLGKLLSLGAILNLVVFFIFIKKRQDYRARGVLLVTVLVAVLTLIFKII
ncbi:hypothetical protein FEZ18_03630 [Oceanihabitans sp. IOP_32]|uniref:hypothetical protein n=1 Tax=Oceanihabitans sp. IOP_32 TaxID=2529032 RepID=UPI001293B249|nr:hypothetical protein [Oceanihabitans sp. IOP_32]QFZ53961.1 hypothetical protein FEZ18_03630 [Oceanihabitans sp. IOP_32]